MHTESIVKTLEIRLIGGDELTAADLFSLNYLYKVDRSEFVFLPRKTEAILINRDIENVEKVSELVKQAFDSGISRKKAWTLTGKITAYVGDNAGAIFWRMWNDWRAETEEIQRREEARQIIKVAKHNGIFSKARKEQEMIKAIYDIGTGLYEKEKSFDSKNGAVYCFVYGYIKVLQLC